MPESTVPAAGLCVITMDPVAEQLSLTVALVVKDGSVAVQEVLSAIVVLAGQEMTGAVWSARTTLNVQLDALPDASVAVMVTTVVPGPVSTVPPAGLWLITKNPAGVQLSVTTALLM